MIQSSRGPRITALGGGSGLSTLLRGLKNYTENLTAIVNVSDDGGGSGVLRRDLGMPPPGDIRNCMQALSNAEPVMEQLLGYRFTDGCLNGQSFGNLLLAALNGISDSFDQAVARMSQVLAITGQVLPVSNANVQLEAVFENGSRVTGESKIFEFKKQQQCRIKQMRLLPEHPTALPEAMQAIRQADLIIFGPGSLYTSLIPNLLVGGIVDEICASTAMKLYVCNIMTEEGETEGMTAADHVAALLAHGAPGMVQMCLVNSSPFSHHLVERYRFEGAVPVQVDREAVEQLGVELVERHVASESCRLARHDAAQLAKVIMELYHERATTKVLH